MNFIYLITGVFFGLVLYKGEVISWFRIQEMFRFESFHMYGVLASAIFVAAIGYRIVARTRGITLAPKQLHRGTWIGGFIFGMGWALTGACPGPLYAHLGAGTSVMIVAIVAALIGTWTYGLVRSRLPH